MTGAQFTIGIPWGAPAFNVFNPQHPLPRSLIEQTSEFTFDETLQPQTPEARGRVDQDAERLRAALAALPAPVGEADIATFIESRHKPSQAMMSGPMDLLFLHTTPMTFGQRPWAIHIESSLTLFEPFFGHFRTWDIDLDATPAWHIVRHLVRAPECRALFTHLRRTQEDLPRLFRDEQLARKIHYAPLGLDLSAGVRAQADAAVAAKDAKGENDEIVFLFTNSWHQDPDSFVKRGGIEVVIGFLTLLMRRPNCRLILRSVIPSHLDAPVRELIRTHPKIEVYEQPVSDAQLFEFLFRADVFLLPSANLHTISMLRAMAMGAVLVTTDATSVDEFVTDGVDGLIIPAWKGVTYWEDRERGLLRESLETWKEPKAQLAGNIVMTAERLVADRELRNRLRHGARERVARRHGLGPWRDGFRAMLRAALNASSP